MSLLALLLDYSACSETTQLQLDQGSVIGEIYTPAACSEISSAQSNRGYLLITIQTTMCFRCITVIWKVATFCIAFSVSDIIGVSTCDQLPIRKSTSVVEKFDLIEWSLIHGVHIRARDPVPETVFGRS